MHVATILQIVVVPLAVVVLAYVLLWIQARPIRDHPLNNPVPGIQTGSAVQITDAGSIGWPSLLDALSTLRVDPDASVRDPGQENSVAEVLGLQEPTVVGRFQPNLIYGVRTRPAGFHPHWDRRDLPHWLHDPAHAPGHSPAGGRRGLRARW
jgi:hypothetical protein